MATKKAGGSTKNGRDSIGKRLGVKRNHDQLVLAGNILIRQRGMTYHAGDNVKVARDNTLFATETGRVKFSKHRYQDPQLKNKRMIRVYVSIEPVELEAIAS
jgi:large subunit ribosomal protein L27